MEKKMMGIIAIVLVVAVAAVAVFGLTMGGGNDKMEIPEVSSGTGTVYGNADGNCIIDQVDIAVIESIISGDRALKDFPFADANCDGVVDNKDLDMVKKIIAKKNVKVNVLDAEGEIVAVQYPVNSFIVLSGSNLAPLMTVLDVTDKVVAAAYSTIDPIRDYSIDQGIKSGKIVKLTTGGSAADMDAITKLKTNVMITEYSSMYDLDSDENIATLNSWGVSVLRLECRDPGDDTSAMAVMGILLDRTEEVENYIDFTNEVYNEIKATIGKKWGTTDILISSLTNNLCGQASGYNTMIEEMAGGNNILDIPDGTKKVQVGDTWIFDSKYNAEVMFLGSACNYGDAGFLEKNINAFLERYTEHYTWKNGDVYYYSTSIPVVCRVSYYAECMYPDLFKEGWADKIHQDYIDTYFDTKFTVEKDKYLILANA